MGDSGGGPGRPRSASWGMPSCDSSTGQWHVGHFVPQVLYLAVGPVSRPCSWGAACKQGPLVRPAVAWCEAALATRSPVGVLGGRGVTLRHSRFWGTLGRGKAHVSLGPKGQ